MPCKLSDKQVEALFKAVLQSIATKLKAGQPYNPEQYMRDLYNAILTRTGDAANAMDYIQHIPRMVITAYNFSEDIADYLTENGVDLNRLDQMRRDFKDIENIKKFVSQQQNQTADLVKEIVEETNSTAQVTPSDEYSRLEEEDKKLKQSAYKQEWFAYPATGLAVTMQEAKDYDGVSLQDNIIDDDPRKQTYFKVVRKINDELTAKGLSNASQLNMGPITGIYLRLVHATGISKEDQYEKDKYYFSTTDNTGTPEQKLARRESGDEVHLVYSDKDGNFLYFDKDGNISTKEAGGTLAYTNLRRPRENNFLPGVQKVDELTRKNPAKAKEIQEKRNLELDILRSARKFISENRDEKVLFNIEAGNNGYTTENFDKPVKISSINLSQGFNPVYYTVGDEKSTYKAGGVYFTAKPYPMPVLIYRPKFENITNLSENLADLVFGSELSNDEKINVLKQFSYSKDTSLFMDKDVLIVSQKLSEGVLDRYPVTADNKQKFISALKGQTVNIVGSLLGSYFKNPVNLDGQVQLIDQKYNNFIADNFFTYLQTNAEGNLVSLNGYNVIQPTAKTQKKIFGEVKVKSKEESSLVTETATDESLEDLKKKLNGTDFSLKKSTLLDNFAALDQIKAAEQWYKSSPLAKVAPFQMLFHVVNSDALAEFTLSGITLYKGANFTDLYHEGFHVFSQMFLTKEQKKALYNETRKLSGSFKTADGRTVKFKDAMDVQLEEFLAEDFRKYVLSDGQSIINGRSTRNSIFRKILNFLKELFKTGSIKQVLADREAVGTIKELYDNLYLGNIYQYKPSLNNVQFSLLNKGAQALDAKDNENKGLSYQDSSVLVQSIDSMIAGMLSELNHSVGSVFTNPELMGAIYEAVKKRFEKKRESFVDESNEARILDFALSNWGDYSKVLKSEEDKGIIAYHKLRSTYLTFEERFADVTPTEQDENEEIKEEGQDGELIVKSDNELREEFGTNAFERKGNEASVYELASNETIYLVKSLPKLDKNGKPELNVLGEPKLVDFNRTWGIIINAVQGAIDKSDMYRRLVATSKQYPELNALVERLGNPMDRTNAATDGPFYHMWTKFFRDMDVYKIPIKELQVEKNIDKNGDVTGFKVQFRESDPLDVQVERKFISSFQNAPASRYIDNSTGSNTIKLANVLQDFPNIDNPVGFLRAVGINMTDNQAIRVQLNTKKNEAVKYIHRAITNAYKSGRNNITLSTLLRKGKDGLDIAGNVRQMFVVEAKYSGNYTNNSIANVKDDPEFDLSLNNTITKLFKELNNMRKDYSEIVSQPHMAHLNHLRNPFAKYSIWLKSMFNIPVNYEEFDASINKRRNNSARSGGATPVTIDIINLNGIKSLINQATKGVLDKAGGIKTANMDINTKFLMDLHTMLTAGVIELPRHASKSSAYGVSLSSMSTAYNQNARHLYVSTGYFTDLQSGFNKAAELLKQKVAAEMERIAIVKSGVVNNISGFSESGQKFTIFDDILTPELKNALIAKANADNSYAVVNSAEFSSEVNTQIAAYLEKLYKENKSIYSELGFISDDLKSSIRNLIKKDNPSAPAINDQQLVDIALRAFTANAFIHNTEAVSVLYGDLALYNHNKEEFHKRNAAIGSTGRGFSWDQSDAEIINQMLGANSYAKSLGIEFSPFTGQLNTAVFKDNVLSSTYYNEYLAALTKKIGNRKDAERILQPYNEMKEGDAQGWITFDAYKILARLEGSWSPKQNEIYNKIINNQKVDPAEVTEYFPPRKYQYSGPLKTDQLHIQAFHKFSLVPMIPSVIKGTNLDILHRNMLKQNMHYALFQSGSKMATITKDGSPDSLYENDNYNERVVPVDAEYTPNTVFIQYLKNQVEVNSTWKDKTIFSTQLRKLIINDLFKQGLPLNQEFGKLIGKYESLLDNLQKLKKEELLKEIGWKEDDKGNLTGNMTNLIKFVRKELTRQDLADHDIDFIDLDPSRNAIKRDLSFSLNAEKIEKLLNTIVVKRLVRQKLNGEQLVQVSGSLYEKRDFKKATEEDKLKYGTNDLPTYRPGKGKDGKTSAAKIKIAIKGDYYRLLALKDVKDLSEKEGITRLEALNRLVKDEEWLDKGDHRKMVTITGVRIPVQGANSMEFMEVYEFLPEEAGNILIPPAEIVAKSGSDFDIDKLTIFQPNIGAVIDRGENFNSKIKEFQKKHPEMDLSRNNVNIILDAAQNDFSNYALTQEEEQVYKLLQTEFGVPKYIKDNGAKGTENQIIETIREILEHPDVFDALIRPNETDLVKGVADELAKENIQGYNPIANKTNAETGKISPTRVLEPRYNLYKHESNNIGKKTLGIGAVDNSYSSIFKRIGAYLSNQYTYRTSTGKEHKRDVRILMPHNKMTAQGNQVISLSDLSTVSGEKISELISQLMNGWVDIEKDAWIFNINGNNTAGPVLLFLLEAGVDFKTAAYFVSQPLVIDYIKAVNRMDSPFYEASGIGENKGRGLNKYNYRKRIVESAVKKEIKGGAAGIYENILKVADNKELTQDELLSNIVSGDKESKSAIKALVHFFELEDMLRGITGLKLTVNVDTKPSKSFYAAQEKIVNVSNLVDNDIFNTTLVNKIITDSPIRSFFTQAFQLKIWEPIMRLRSDKKVNDFLIKVIKKDFVNKADGSSSTSFKDAEKFAAAFKNDLPMFLMQNYLKGIDVDNIKEYNGLFINESLSVEAVQLKYGAFVKEGVMYVDADQIRKDFDTKAYNGEGYQKRGLHKVSPSFFNTGDAVQQFKEYSHFVLEREYLRSITPVQKEQTRETYEKDLAERALRKTYNWANMFKGPDSIASHFEKIRTTYPELAKEYMLFEQVQPIKDKLNAGMMTLKLVSEKMPSELINTLHENLQRLADFGIVKVADPVANREISGFFNRLIVGEYLRAGITKSSESLSKILPTENLMRLLEEPMKQIDRNGISEETLNEYYSLFKSNWGRSKAKSSSNRFRNYINTTVKSDNITTEDEELDFGLRDLYTDDRGITLYNAPTVKSLVNKLLSNNGNYMFVYPTDVDGKADSKGIRNEYKKIGNSISVPVIQSGTSTPMSDNTYDKNVEAIDQALKLMEEQVNDGAQLAFPKEGLTLFEGKEMLGKNAPRTFGYLSTELYKRFGYVHPGAENDLGFRKQYQSTQSVSDEEVDEFMKKCFGN
jgi:hypothetical protein